MRRHDEGDPRTSVPVFLALRGAGRPQGPGIPLPRRPPVRGRTAETRGGSRCVSGPTRRGAPPPSRGNPGPRPSAVTAKALRRRGHGNASMRIQVRLFATYREIVGSRGFTWSSRDGLSLRELVDGGVAKYPGVAGPRDTMLLAVNHDLAASDRVLQDGDEVALLPPVSGGAR